MNKLHLFFLMVCALVGLSSAGAQQGSTGYRIGPKDLIDIQVLEEPDASSEVRVQADGTITLPLIGTLSVEGRTTAQVSREIQEFLEKDLLQRATVTVRVVEFRSRPISVIGAVNTPGNLQFSGRWRLIEALTAAGGLSPEHGNTIYVMRRSENGLSAQLQIPVDELMLRGSRTLNIPIYSGDLINVSPAIEVRVYCLGEVNRPGAVTFKDSERITLLTAIANAGGPTDRAGKRALIRRETADGQEEIEVHLREIIDGRRPDVDLKAGDVIVVKESFF